MINNPAKIHYYTRDLFSKIETFLKTKEIIAIVGSRQVGKTTLLQKIYNELSKKQKCLFLTFENRSELELFERDVESFKDLYCTRYQVIFIDEFQYAKDAGQKLKYLFDTTDVKFFISGSASLQIKEAGKYLVGRIFTFRLHPFSFSEYLRAIDEPIYRLTRKYFNQVQEIFSGNNPKVESLIKSETIKNKLAAYFEQYLIFGGYPRVVSAKNTEEKKQVLESIVDNYLLRDIQSLLKLATENELMTLARSLSLQSGNLVSFTELSNPTHLSYKEVKKHIRILEETFILNLVYPYFRNKRTELVKNPKVFFGDNGFHNKLIDNFMPLAARADSGALAENFIFNSLSSSSAFLEINFWRTKSQAEVDFILSRENQIIPLEAKFAPMGKKIIGKSLFSFINKYKCKTAIVTTNGDFGIRKTGAAAVYFIPAFFI
ncbi:hypothetical protein A3H40_01490 [Candidatus Daviesbacteria bacterium RIFCSPLOWO2_02_FULL_38_15]|uniref:AAA+ ATPase domain-containing protein n=1 Tax=Candidatus Daviesbacteria bacterium RIFCSPLOWO2_02_FULL_38_15 TaxID=1797794 RepID=A0A1F5N209_9BACT|nr:MAG: hypothetical protein A3H40_01490 [Candidatus Daviesbacteria bacterium RIFCSPLOWO2_02_FULL_38_15]